MILAVLATAAAPLPADAPGRPFFIALRDADTRLASIAARLATANVGLCDRRSQSIGLVLHGLNQYERSAWPTARSVFAFSTPVSVEAVLPGGPAQRAGVLANDGVLSVAGKDMPTAIDASLAGSGDRDRALEALDAVPLDQTVTLILQRDGRPMPLTLDARPVCRSHFEIVIGQGFDAQADGLQVQLGEKFFEGFTDEEVAVVVAHELAHNILHHRERLDAAKVRRGIASEFGRNARLFRETEDQADALSVYLLANAGYDPFAPGKFWRAYANKVGLEGIFRSRTHPSGKRRARAMDAIATLIPKNADRPIVPTMLDRRNEPLR